MEENVALDSSKQKKFVKSLKGIKNLIKKTGAIPDKPIKERKPIKSGKVTKKKRKARGLVYLSHIPHGFYEHQMTEYFKQFGMVTNARVIRSQRTGRSKGHAFVEFKDIAVAQVVAETMNNYLMGKRLIKAVYIPPKDQRTKARRKNWNDQFNPGKVAKLNVKKSYNADKNEIEDLKIARKLLSNLTNTKKKLQELGIDYDFFTPVDVPEGLAEEVVVKEEKPEVTDNKEDSEQKPKKKKKNKKRAAKKLQEDSIINNGEELSESSPEKKPEQKTDKKKQKKLNKTNEVPANSKVIGKENENVSDQITDVRNKKNKKNKQKEMLKPEVNKSQQEQKKLKMKEAGVKPPEDFITIKGDDESDDSDYQFDSDEYENMMNDDDSDSNISNEDEDDADISHEELLDTSESKVIPVKKNNKKTKKKGQSVIQPIQSQKKVEQEQKKRKTSEKIVVHNKKPKFEKQTNKLPKKQLKMRK